MKLKIIYFRNGTIVQLFQTKTFNMEKVIQSVLFILFIISYSPLFSQECNTNYGINLGKITAWKSEWQFVNIAHNSLGWFPPNAIPNFNDRIDEDLLTPDKYLPNGQSGLLAVVWDAPERFSEDFVLTYSGTADVSIYLTNHPGTTVTLDQPGRIEFSLQNEKSLFVRVTANTSSDFMSDLRITKASQENLYQVYDPVYLQDLSKYQILRYLDFGKINNSQVKEISDYSTPNTIIQNEVCLEYMIELANILGADPWFCIPMQASDNFVTQWAQTIKNMLNPNLKVRVELSNEVWNTGFSQAQEAVTLGQQSGVLGNTNNNDRPAYYGYRSAEIHNLFESEFDSGGDSPDLIKVVAWQAASTWHTENYVIPYYKLPFGANYVPDEIAIAPYFGGRLGWVSEVVNGQTINYSDEVINWDLNDLFNELEFGTVFNGQGSIQQSLDWTNNYLDLINNENIASLSLYEGGQHLATTGPLHGTPIVDLFIDANRDQRMGDMYTIYLNSLKNMGVGAIALFNSESIYNTSGSWGLKNYIGQPQNEAPKYVAFSNFIDNNPSPANCNSCPQQGQACDDNNPNTQNDIIDSNCQCVGTTAEDCTTGYGINVGKVESFQSEWEFVNIAHHALGWFPPNQQPVWNNWLDDSQLTPDKYLPPGQSGILAVIWDAPLPINENFVVTYTGNADVDVYPNPDITVNSNQQGRIELTATNAKFIFLEVTANSNESISNLRVTKASDENLTQTFSPIYLDDIRHYQILRFIDFSEINFSKVSTLSDYTPANALLQDVVSLENIIILANEINADPWINIPLLADDAFVTQWAQTLKNQLNPNLNVRLELSNEVWNGAFSAYNQSILLAHEKEIQETDRPWEDGAAYYGHRSAEVHAIFENVFNSGGQSPGLIKVIAWQAANSWLAKHFVLPKYRLVCGTSCIPDEIAIAPYFGHQLGSQTNEPIIQNWNKDMVIDQLLFGNSLNGEGSIQIALDWTSAYLDFINDEGIATLSLYEGGQHLAGFAGVQNNQTITDLFIATNRYSRMQEVYDSYLTGLQNLGIDAMCMYSSNDTYNLWGSWGLKEIIGQDEINTPKYVAYKNFIQANPLPQNCNDDCEFNRTVDDQLILSGIYDAENLVSTRNGIVISPEDVTFRANTIYLEKDFIVDLGATFLAEIAPCN